MTVISSAPICQSDHTADGIVKADDFISDGRRIVAVRWWGSYIGDLTQRVGGNNIGPFDIGFFLSDANPPTNVAHPNSLPAPNPRTAAQVVLRHGAGNLCRFR